MCMFEGTVTRLCKPCLDVPLAETTGDLFDAGVVVRHGLGITSSSVNHNCCSSSIGEMLLFEGGGPACFFVRERKDAGLTVPS